MLRLSEIKLPSTTPKARSRPRFARASRSLAWPRTGSSVTPCSAVHDARKRADIKLTYIVDVEVTDEAAAIKRLAGKPHCGVTPDMAYHFVTKAPEHGNFLRPVVIGMGPCGLFAG